MRGYRSSSYAAELRIRVCHGSWYKVACDFSDMVACVRIASSTDRPRSGRLDEASVRSKFFELEALSSLAG